MYNFCYCCQEAFFIEGSQLTKYCLSRHPYKIGVQITFHFPQSLDFKAFQTKVRILPWQMSLTVSVRFFSSSSAILRSALSISRSRKSNRIPSHYFSLHFFFSNSSVLTLASRFDDRVERSRLINFHLLC